MLQNLGHKRFFLEVMMLDANSWQKIGESSVYSEPAKYCACH